MIDAQIEVKQNHITIETKNRKFRLSNEADSPNGYYFAIWKEELEELKELSRDEKKTSN